MRRVFFSLSVLALSACATAPVPEPSMAPQTGEARLDGLPAQTLGIGQCGLFFWTSAPPHQLVLFENETAGEVKIFHEGQIIALGAAPQPAGMIAGDRVERIYPAPSADLIFTLEGVVGEATASGTRIDRALLKVRQPSGEEIVRPVRGVRACRTEAGTGAPR